MCDRCSTCPCSLSPVQCPHLQPLVDGLSCSELSRLKALELLGGDGLWELELWGGEGYLSKSTRRERKCSLKDGEKKLRSAPD